MVAAEMPKSGLVLISELLYFYTTNTTLNEELPACYIIHIYLIIIMQYRF